MAFLHIHEQTIHETEKEALLDAVNFINNITTTPHIAVSIKQKDPFTVAIHYNSVSSLFALSVCFGILLERRGIQPMP